MIFYWSLSGSKSPQVSRTLLSILVNLNDAVFWMVSAHPRISNSFNSLTKPLGIIPSALITTGITVTFMSFSFFSPLARSRYLSLFFFFDFYSQLKTAKSTSHQVLFLLTITKSGLTKIGLSVYILKSQRILSISFSRVDSCLCIYHLVVWSNFNFLHNSKWIIFPIQSCLIFYTSFALVCCIHLLCD